MRYLLNLVYLLVLVALLPWLLWQAVRGTKRRAGFSAKFFGSVPCPAGTRPRIWLHSVSVGEVNQLAPLLEELRRQLPEYELVISTTTTTGYALARRKYPELLVFYAPLDFSWATSRALRRIRPELLVLVELELWPNLVAAARRNGIQVAVVNGRLGERSHRGYRRLRSLVRQTLTQLSLVAAQDATIGQRFIDLGLPPERLQVTGSIKFDGAETDRANPRTQALASLAGLGPDSVVLLAGSTQDPEEAIALEVFQQFAAQYPRLRLILVPRHPERFEAVGRLLDRAAVAWQRRSQLDAAHPPAPGSEPPRILLVDAVGELGAWWGTAQIAFVGGSLGSRGGQNMIEPAAYGAALSFGPQTFNFRDVVERLLAADAAVVVADKAALATFVGRCLAEPAYATALGERARALVATQLGASRKTVELLAALLHGK